MTVCGHMWLCCCGCGCMQLCDCVSVRVYLCGWASVRLWLYVTVCVSALAVCGVSWLWLHRVRVFIWTFCCLAAWPCGRARVFVWICGSVAVCNCMWRCVCKQLYVAGVLGVTVWLWLWLLSGCVRLWVGCVCGCMAMAALCACALLCMAVCVYGCVWLCGCAWLWLYVFACVRALV